MANNLTIPVQVTNYNFEYLTKIVNEGKANFVIKKDNGSRINLEHKLFFRGTMLEHGDVVIRADPKTGKEAKENEWIDDKIEIVEYEFKDGKWRTVFKNNRTSNAVEQPDEVPADVPEKVKQ